MATSSLSAFGPRANQYFKAAKNAGGSIYNANGTVNKDNLNALKGDVGPVNAPAPPKQHGQTGRIDVVA